jgi:hypothetical protein
MNAPGCSGHRSILLPIRWNFDVTFNNVLITYNAR